MRAFFVELQNLHDVFYVAEGVPMFYQVEVRPAPDKTQHPTVEVRPAPDKTWACFWQHRKHHVDFAAPQKRHASQHAREILYKYTQGILK